MGYTGKLLVRSQHEHMSISCQVKKWAPDLYRELWGPKTNLSPDIVCGRILVFNLTPQKVRQWSCSTVASVTTRREALQYRTDFQARSLVEIAGKTGDGNTSRHRSEELYEAAQSSFPARSSR